MNLPFGLTDEHLMPADANGIRKFNDAGTEHLSSQMPTTDPFSMQSIAKDIQNNPVNTPQSDSNPFGFKPANTGAVIGAAQTGLLGGTLQGASDLVAPAGAAGATGGGGGIMGLIASLL